MVLVEGASSANASASILCRFNGDTGSNYYYTGARIEGLAAYSTGVVGNDYGSTTAAIFGVMGNNAGSIVAGSLFLTGCNSAGAKMFIMNGSANNGGSSSGHKGYNLGGYYSGSSTISSVSVVSSTGNLDAGTVYIYTTA